MNGWISVKDKLPKSEPVIVWAAKAGCPRFASICRYDHIRKSWKDRIATTSVVVTHWMPLPDPPEAA